MFFAGGAEKRNRIRGILVQFPRPLFLGVQDAKRIDLETLPVNAGKLAYIFAIITRELPDVSVSAFLVADRIYIYRKVLRSGFLQNADTSFDDERIHDTFIAAKGVGVKLPELPV